MINRDVVLIKRAVMYDGAWGWSPSDVDYKRSAVEGIDGVEFVVLRSDTDILSVFSVEGWQIELLAPEDWPDELLDESLPEEAETAVQ